MIDDNDLTADAFENDNKEHLNKEFGRTVTSKYEVIGSGNFGLIADPQYNPLGKKSSLYYYKRLLQPLTCMFHYIISYLHLTNVIFYHFYIKYSFYKARWHFKEDTLSSFNIFLMLYC